MAASALSPSTPPTKFTMFRTTWIIYSILVFRFFPIHSIEMRAYFIRWMVLQWRPRRTKLRYIVFERRKTRKENKSFIFQFNQWLKANWEQQQWDREQQQHGKKTKNKFLGSGSDSRKRQKNRRFLLEHHDSLNIQHIIWFILYTMPIDLQQQGGRRNDNDT